MECLHSDRKDPVSCIKSSPSSVAIGKGMETVVFLGTGLVDEIAEEFEVGIEISPDSL